jgi:hypothetical protein
MMRPAINESTNAAVGLSVTDIAFSHLQSSKSNETRIRVRQNRRGREPTTTVAYARYQILHVTKLQMLTRLCTARTRPCSNEAKKIVLYKNSKLDLLGKLDLESFMIRTKEKKVLTQCLINVLQ